MQIIASYDATIANAPAGYKTALQAAIQYVQASLVSNITVNITFSFTGSGLASATTSTSQYGASDVISALQNIPAVNAALPASIPAAFTGAQMTLTDPLARQLGLSTSAQPSDSTVTLGTSQTWNWDPSVASIPNGLGAFGTFVHEITEALGRSAGSDGTFENSPLALFRYTAPGTLSTNGAAAGGYFSMDKGVTNLVSMGNTGGDLADFNVSDDAFGTGSGGTPDQVSKDDMLEMQAIGYTLSSGDKFGGGNSVTFDATNNNSALLTNSGTNWDVANGSAGLVMLTNDMASVVGGDDAITFIAGLGTTRDAASLYSTGANADNVTGSGGVLVLNSAKANISGGAELIYFDGNSANSATLSNTSAWDLLNGSNGTATLNAAQASFVGGGNTVNFDGSLSDAISLYSTNAVADTVTGSNGAVMLNTAQATVSGSSDTVWLDGNTADAVTIKNTTTGWDVVRGANGTIALTGGQASVVGDANTITFDASTTNAVSIYGAATSGDTVNGSNGSVALNSATATVNGGGDTVYLNGTGSVATLKSTSGSADVVVAASQTINLTGAQATVTGNSDTIGVAAGSSVWLNGTGENLGLVGSYGLDQVNGFVASDVLNFSAQNAWASFAAFQSSGAMTQTGADTQIKLDANNILTLTGVTASTLTSSNFTFASNV